MLDTAVRRLLRLVGQSRPARAEGGEFDVDEHHRLAHRARAGVGGAAQERRRRAAADPGRRVHRRGDRRVRPYAAVPGRGQLAGQPDPGRRPARRADRPARQRGRPCASRAGFALDSADAGRRAGAGGGGRGPATPTTSWSASGCPARRSPRASTGPTWTCRPTSSPCSRRWPPYTTGWSWCWPTARPSPVDLGAPRRRRPGVLAVRAGGRRRGGRPAARPGQPERQAGREPPAPAGRLRRLRSTSPATPGWCATARGCSSATATTTRPSSRSAIRSASGCPTRRSRWPTSTYASAARSRAATWPSAWPSR